MKTKNLNFQSSKSNTYDLTVQLIAHQHIMELMLSPKYRNTLDLVACPWFWMHLEKRNTKIALLNALPQN